VTGRAVLAVQLAGPGREGCLRNQEEQTR
jgi:hypothetical protein